MLSISSNCFHNHCNIMYCTYKGVGGGDSWESGLYLPVGPFGVAMSPRTASYKPRQAWGALRDAPLTQG